VVIRDGRMGHPKRGRKGQGAAGWGDRVHLFFSEGRRNKDKKVKRGGEIRKSKKQKGGIMKRYMGSFLSKGIILNGRGSGEVGKGFRGEKKTGHQKRKGEVVRRSHSVFPISAKE